MTSKAVAKQLAMKLKLEKRFKPKLKKFFRRIGQDIKTVWTATGTIPNLNSFAPRLMTILNDHYRDIAKQFTGIVQESLKSSITITETKQHEEIPGMSDSGDNSEALLLLLVLPVLDTINDVKNDIVTFINEHSAQQTGHILRTTQQELQTISARVIIDASVQGEVLTQAEIADQIARAFAKSSDSRVNTLAMTETQTPSETMKLIEATALAILVADATGVDEGLAVGTVVKKWNAVIDSVTRSAHLRANGQVVPNNLPFLVGGERLPVPGSSALGASLSNIINCRCVATFSVVGGDALPVNITLQ